MAPIFLQLTAVSQNDPGCPNGAAFTAEVISFSGGKPSSHPPSISPFHKPVKLPIPPPPGVTPPESPTWFLSLDGSTQEASFTIVINGGRAETTIIIDGANIPRWVEQNEKQPTNQINRPGNCGIFGFAQKSTPERLPIDWIYTVTAAVTNPQVHG